MEALVALANTATLSARVSVVRGLNPGKFTLQGTNTYLVGTGARRLLIDTGEGKPGYLPLLQQALLERGNAVISDILITHRHHDHIGGIKHILDASSHSPIKIWKRITDQDTARDIHYNHIEEGQVFEVEGAKVKAIYTPGHLDDHVVFYLQDECALFSGDSVLGQGSTVFTDLKEYMDSLRKTLEHCVKIDKIYPGHGPDLENGSKVVEQYIQHRVDRENEILDFLRRQKAPCTSWQIVETIYAKYNQNIWPAAERSVLLHLEKLVVETRVIRDGLGPKASYVSLG
ncbi:beta-lactamase-like protein 2-like protein [Rhizoclosmatium globosum]|uniref:Beta-lactamase-like protein 2-like protein n=1 Tax=Rhizoclosmatium globosum TaxID=329046 RepID=A0A1Y2CSG2_9FUNG|nr:beta-lactamase-like protein 2-like protein [Rhizoclosmatium globosum]|eukprot:ORY49907.1 beta-lactamase-like protein 2-like protein [Rhizoclosmatium globosum]